MTESRKNVSQTMNEPTGPGCPSIPPQSYIRPTIMKSMIIKTLIIASQYSDSPTSSKINCQRRQQIQKEKTAP